MAYQRHTVKRTSVLGGRDGTRSLHTDAGTCYCETVGVLDVRADGVVETRVSIPDAEASGGR